MAEERSRQVNPVNVEEVDAFPLAPRGAKLDPLTPGIKFPLSRKVEVWAENVPELLERAKSELWRPEELPWGKVKLLPADLEEPLCQFLTFLAEHEYLSLYLTSKFITKINPYFGEVALLLSFHSQDEAKHIDLLGRRASLSLGYQKVSASVQYAFRNVLELNDYSKAIFMLGVIGEASIADMLSFLSEALPDESLREIFNRVVADEDRHIAYALGKTRYRLEREPEFLGELTTAMDELLAYLYIVSGTEEEVKDSLTKLLGGGSGGRSLELGLGRIKEMYKSIDRGRLNRLRQLGIDEGALKKMAEAYTLAGSGLC